MRRTAAGFLLAMTLLALPALAGDINSAAIVDYGMYTREPGKPSVYMKKTDRVKAALGVSFGFSYVAEGARGTEQTVTVVIRTPGVRLPKRKKPVTYNEFATRIIVGERASVGWTFEQDAELVPGPWTFQVEYEGRILVEKTFEVYE